MRPSRSAITGLSNDTRRALDGYSAVSLPTSFTARYSVDRWTPKRLAISPTSFCRSAMRALAIARSRGESFTLRPQRRPRARAEASPALVRSRIRLRSNSARAAKTWKTSRPAGEFVWMLSVRETNPTPLSSRSPTIRTRSDNDRPRRSSRQTTRTSPSRRALRQLSSSGRAADFPEACSS